MSEAIHSGTERRKLSVTSLLIVMPARMLDVILLAILVNFSGGGVLVSSVGVVMVQTKKYGGTSWEQRY